MKVVLQRVTNASVTVDDKIIGEIGKGYLILLGVGEDDTEAAAEKLVDKIVKLRIFADEAGKTNLSLADVDGEILVVSQFTLYADCHKGNRPSFVHAGNPEKAERLYEYFAGLCAKRCRKVATGSFGAEMQISLVNDGPFTILLDS
ncbi:D-aminoacyl-tRNA deacylase [Anaerolentibacter hominis]|uniref:D-aminoacyl-tRNA deacylase n=1 Tax=Anaerolentibacter hominis TaxID=3079009 RepID=UPI0031B89AB3